MKERIAGLLNDKRLPDLMVTPEFKRARERLYSMLKRLVNGEQINGKDQEFISYIERHIKNIERHIEHGVVDGQPQSYLMITKIGEDK